MRVLEPRYVSRIREKVLLITHTLEDAKEAMEIRGDFKSKRSQERLRAYGHPIIYTYIPSFLTHLKVGEVVELELLRKIADKEWWAKSLIREIPSGLVLADKEALKHKDELPRVFRVSDKLWRWVKRKNACSWGAPDTEVCVWKNSYWIIYGYYNALLVPRSLDLEVLAKYLSEDEREKIRKFTIQEECTHEACDKARELKAMLELLG